MSDEKQVKSEGYNVVFRVVAECETKGAITWSSYKSKEEFDKIYDEDAKKQEEVVAEGISEATAIELCRSPEAIRARDASLQKTGRNLSRLLLLSQMARGSRG